MMLALSIASPILMLIGLWAAIRSRGQTYLGMSIEIEREKDGRYIAAIPALPGVLAYGQTKPEAIAACKQLAIKVLSDKF